MLAELGKNSTSRFRVQEGDVQLLGSLAGCLVDQANAQAVAFGKCVGHAVFDAEGHVMNTVVTFVEPFLDGAFG